VQPASVIEEHEKGIVLQSTQVRYHRGGDVLHALLEQGKRQVMMIDHVITVPWSPYHRNQMATEEVGFLAIGMLPPVRTLGLYFAHADGDLRGAQICNGDRTNPRFARQGHDSVLGRMRSPSYPVAPDARRGQRSGGVLPSRASGRIGGWSPVVFCRLAS
jgi:hypothetical protein